MPSRLSDIRIIPAVAGALYQAAGNYASEGLRAPLRPGLVVDSISLAAPTRTMSQSHRETIHVEDAEILQHSAFAGEQFVLRIHAPTIARYARPGCFAHVRCDIHLPMRRPMSVMRVGPDDGWVEFLYKRVGEGSARLSERGVGERISVLGPIGQGFSTHPERSRPLLLGGGVGIPPMVFLAERLRSEGGFDPLVLMGSEVPFPFTSRPSQIVVPGVPDGVIGCMPLMEDWGIASRLASLQGYAGCFDGYITELARHWLAASEPEALATTEIFACGPTPMMRAAAALAAEFELPCQVCLEEFMACAVGGCAGCAVRVDRPEGPAMKRVCVDGPVFQAKEICWDDLPH